MERISFAKLQPITSYKQNLTSLPQWTFLAVESLIRVTELPIQGQILMPLFMLKNTVLMGNKVLPKKGTGISEFKEISSKKSGGIIPSP